MKGLIPYTINVGGQLLDLGEPRVMGILNLTPDSFYAASRKQSDEEIAARTRQILGEGADIIDVGAYSTRPDACEVSADEETSRLRHGLKILRGIAPEAIVSVDTFRADVAKMCVNEFGVQIINDVTGGELDEKMFPTVAELGVPYILTHSGGYLPTAGMKPEYDDLLAEMLQYLGRKVHELHLLGVKDIILDPGFGFGKTLDQNYDLMNRMQDLQVLELPILAGVSRKSMIWKMTNSTPQESLPGTCALHAIALQKGASILRVHDVKAAADVVTIVKKMLTC